MVEYGILYASYCLPVAGFILFLAMWWPHRKGPLLSSVPWIVAYFLFSNLPSIATPAIIERFEEVMKSAGSLHMAHLTFGCAVAFVAARKLGIFLLTLIVTFNAAFLLQSAAPQGRFQSWLAGAHRFQRWLGISLLVTAFFPIVLMVGVSWIWRP